MGCGCKRNKSKSTNTGVNKTKKSSPVVKPSSKPRTK